MPASLSELGAKPQSIAPIDGSISKTVQQNMAKQADQQAALVNAVGGKRRKRYKGGATAAAPPLRIGYNDPSGATQNNANAINKLAIDTQQAAVFDKASSQAQTQALAAQQQKALSGGRRRKTNKRRTKRRKTNKRKYSRKYRR
jgi:hypothetical protein